MIGVKGQNVIEYVSTWGWAMLILLVVLAALFSTGIFNGSNIPHASPGSCSVLRPYGPGTFTAVSLQGTCNGALPTSVANLSTVSVLKGANVLGNQNENSTSAWIYPATSGGIVYTDTGASATCPTLQMDIQANGLMEIQILNHIFTPTVGTAVTYNAWNYVSGSFNPVSPYNAILVVNGNVVKGTGVYTGSTCGTVGGTYTYKLGKSFSGKIANIQLYSSILTANQLLALDYKGIGGAPIDINRLLAWWVLNGDAQDYSGNGDNVTTVTNVIFTTNWQSGYTPT